MSILLAALAKAAEVISEVASKGGEGTLKAAEGMSEAGGLKSAGETLPDFANKEMASADESLEGKQGELPNFNDQEIGEKSDLPAFDKEEGSESVDSTDKEVPGVTDDGASQIADVAPENDSMSAEDADGGGDALEERKTGGTYGELISNDQWGGHLEEHPPHEVHHMPADSVNGLERNDGPAIVMEKADHRQTASFE